MKTYKPLDIEVIAISGKQGSGKNFIGEQVLHKMLSEKPTLFCSFADHFKVDAIVKDGLDREKVFGRKDEFTRVTLQRRGTEEGRDKYGENIWVDLLYEWMLLHQSRGTKRIFVLDVRFSNEIEFVKQIGGTVIRINSPKRTWDTVLKEADGDEEKALKITLHPSETSLDDYTEFDYIIDNDYDDDAITQTRDIVLHYEATRKLHTNKLIFMDLDDTICHCYLNYNDLHEQFLTKIKQEVIDEDHFEVFKETHTECAEKERYAFHYYRESLPTGMVNTLKEFDEKIPDYNLHDKFSDWAYNLGISVHSKEFVPLAHNVIDKINNFDPSEGKIVIYTLGERADQVRKIVKLGINHFDIETVKRKDKTTMKRLMDKYRANHYYMIGDSFKNDIEPAIECECFDGIYHVYSKFPKEGVMMTGVYNVTNSVVYALEDIEQQ